jgi:hypothetical protein
LPGTPTNSTKAVNARFEMSEAAFRRYHRGVALIAGLILIDRLNHHIIQPLLC